MSKTELRDSPTVSNWMGRLSKSSHKGMLHHFSTWIKWVRENGDKFSGFSPEDFVEFQREAGNGERYEVLDLIQRYIGTLEGRGGYKKTTYSNIRSFFRHNRVELPQDPTFTVRAEKPKILGTLTVEEIKHVIISSNPCYQAVFTSMFQGGMGLEEVVFWSENGLEALKQNLREDLDVLKVNLPGRKKFRNEYPFYTLLGSDSIEALRNWLKHRPETCVEYHPDDMEKRAKNRRVINREPTTAIFTNQFGNGISKHSVGMYWNKHMKRLGIRQGGRGDGKNIHEMRDVFRSLYAKSGRAPEVVEFLMGHQIDKLGYNKAHQDDSWVIKEYVKALPMFQIMSSGMPFGQVDLDEVEKQATEIEELGAKFDKLVEYLVNWRKESAEEGGIARDDAELKQLMEG